VSKESSAISTVAARSSLERFMDSPAVIAIDRDSS
jgi:hypothetical protein